MLTAETEMLSFTAINPDQAAFRVAGARLRTLDGKQDRCFAGIVTPAQDARIQYQRNEAEGFGIASIRSRVRMDRMVRFAARPTTTIRCPIQTR